MLWLPALLLPRLLSPLLLLPRLLSPLLPFPMLWLPLLPLPMLLEPVLPTPTLFVPAKVMVGGAIASASAMIAIDVRIIVLPPRHADTPVSGTILAQASGSTFDQVKTNSRLRSM